jgi:hypothetical protein
MEKDTKEILTHKNQLIEEIKKIDKTLLFKTPEKKRIGFFKRLAIIFGYGKKG